MTTMNRTMLSCVILLCLLSSISARWDIEPEDSNVESDPEKRCEIVDGIFGKEGSSQFVTFCYEVETVEVPKDSTENIIAAIEIAMAEMILPPLFGPACPSMRRLTRRKLAATGVSVNPTDVLLADANCTVELTNNADPCFVVDGIFTIYTDGTDVNSQALLSLLAAASLEGAFNGVHPDIVQVYVCSEDSNGIEGGFPSPTSAPAGRNSQLGLGMYLGVAAAALLVIGAVLFYRRRLNQANVDADSTILTPNAGVPNNSQVYDLNSINQ